MDFGLSVRYVFKDDVWFKKLIRPALWGLVPVVGMLVLGGWGLKVGKRVLDGQAEKELPMVEFSTDLRIGILASLIDLIYALPAVIFFAVTIGVSRIALNAEGFTRGLLLLFSGLFGLVGLLLFLLWFLVATPAFANFLAKDRFSAAFHFQELFGLLKTSFGSWLVVILGQFVAIMILAPLGILFFGIGLLFTTTYAAVFWSHLLAQAYQNSTKTV